MIFDNILGKNAIDLLKDDHRQVDALFRELEKADDATHKVEIAQKICAELTVHAQIEEEIFYPAARKALPESKTDLVSEASVEHASLKKLIADIDGSSPRDELFDANLKVLGEYVKHHVREEETELMPAVRRTDIDLETLGEQLSRRKDALRAQQERRSVPGSSTRVRVPKPGRASAGRGKRKSAAAKRAASPTRKAARKSGRRASTATPRSRASAARKRAGTRAPSRRPTRTR